MFAITIKEIQKNVFVIVCFMVLLVAMTLAFNDYLPGIFEKPDQKDMLATNFSLMLGIFVNMIVFAGLMSCEKEEDQSNGYAFCRTLPIESWQIVLGKFLAAFIYAVFAILLVLGLTSVLGVKLESKLLPVAYTLFVAGIALLLVGVLYLFAFRIRYSKLLPVIMLVYVFSMMLPQVLHLVLLMLGYEETVEYLFSQLTLPIGILLFSICLVGFGGIAYAAIQVKKKVPLPL